jgi:hypothetical protein
VSGRVGPWSARRLLARRGGVLAGQPAGVEEKTRGESAGDDGDHHGDDNEAAAGKYEGQRVEMHLPAMFDFGRGAEVGPKVTRTLDRRRFLVLIGAGLATACTPIAQTSPSPTASAIPPLGANPTRGIWPAQYHAAPQPVRDAYAWAATHENILQYIPCYCGCGANGHRNNYDCFVRAKAANGWITMDLHGLSCGTCVSITLETAAMTAKGLTVRQMRTTIDARWSATGPSTPTPLP